MQSKLAAAKPRDKLCHFHHVGHITKHASNQKTVSDQKNCICRRIRKTPSPAFASQSLKWALLPLKYFHFPAGGHLRRETREWLHWHNIRAPSSGSTTQKVTASSAVRAGQTSSYTTAQFNARATRASKRATRLNSTSSRDRKVPRPIKSLVSKKLITKQATSLVRPARNLPSASSRPCRALS